MQGIISELGSTIKTLQNKELAGMGIEYGNTDVKTYGGISSDSLVWMKDGTYALGEWYGSKNYYLFVGSAEYTREPYTAVQPVEIELPEWTDKVVHVEAIQTIEDEEDLQYVMGMYNPEEKKIKIMPQEILKKQSFSVLAIITKEVE